MPNWKSIAGLGAEVGVASNLMDAFNYNKDFDWTDIMVPGKGLYNAIASGEGRRIGSQLLAAGMPLSGAAVGKALKGEAGALIGGLAGSAAALPVETFTLNQAKQNMTADTMADTAGNNSKLMAAIGLGALGLGGLAVAKYLKKQNMPEEHGTIQYKLKGKKDDPDSEATVTLPINHPEFSPRMVEGLNAGIKRGLGKTVRYNSFKRDPNTGRNIPYETWLRLYGDKEHLMHSEAMGKAASTGFGKAAGGPTYTSRDRKTVDAINKVYKTIKGKSLKGEDFKKEVERQYARDNRNGSKPKIEKRSGALGGVLAGLGLDKRAVADTDPSKVLVNEPTGHESGEREDKSGKKDSHEARYGFTLGGAGLGALGGFLSSLSEHGALTGHGGRMEVLGDTLRGAGMGALAGMGIDTYRNLSDVSDSRGLPVRNAFTLGGAGLGALGGGIVGGKADGVRGALAGALLGAGGGAMTGMGIDTYRASGDIVKDASADPGDITMQLTDRKVRPARVEDAGNRWHESAGKSFDNGSAGKSIGEAGSTQGIDKRAFRLWSEGAGTTGTAIGGGLLGGLAGTVLADSNGVSPILGGLLGTAAGAFIPNLVGKGLGAMAGARTIEEQAAHDSNPALAEYIVPGYGAYQYERRVQTAREGDRAREALMKSYLNTGAMPGGMHGVPSNIDREDAGNPMSESEVDDGYGSEEDDLDKWASCKKKLTKESAVNTVHSMSANGMQRMNDKNRLGTTQVRHSIGADEAVRMGQQQRGGQPYTPPANAPKDPNAHIQNQADYNEATRIATDMQMYGHARVRGADGKLYHPGQVPQATQQPQQAKSPKAGNTTIPTQATSSGLTSTSSSGAAPVGSVQGSGVQAGQQPLTMGQAMGATSSWGGEAFGGASQQQQQQPAQQPQQQVQQQQAQQPQQPQHPQLYTLNTTDNRSEGQKYVDANTNGQASPANGATKWDDTMKGIEAKGTQNWTDQDFNDYYGAMFDKRQAAYEAHGAKPASPEERAEYIRRNTERMKGNMASDLSMTDREKADPNAAYNAVNQRVADATTLARNIDITRKNLRRDVADERTVTNITGKRTKIDRNTPEQYLANSMFDRGGGEMPTGVDPNTGKYTQYVRRINSAGLPERVAMEDETVDTAGIRESLDNMAAQNGAGRDSMPFRNLGSKQDYDAAIKWMQDNGGSHGDIDALTKDRTARYGRDYADSWYLDNKGKSRSSNTDIVRSRLAKDYGAKGQQWAGLNTADDYHQGFEWLRKNRVGAGTSDRATNDVLHAMEADFKTRFGNQTEYRPDRLSRSEAIDRVVHGAPPPAAAPVKPATATDDEI